MVHYKLNLRSYRPWTTPKEIPLTIFALVWFVSCVFLVTLADVYLDRANPFVKVPVGKRIRAADPLLEFLHPYYLKAGFAWDFPDPLCQFSPFFMILRILLGGKQSCLIGRRLGYIVGMGFFIRIFFVMMTMLPNSNLTCSIDPNPNLFLYAIEVLSQKKVTCGDVVFSGHSVLFMSASLVWVQNPVPWFSRRLTSLINFIVISFSAFGVTIMIASTFHYTVDCVISVCTMLFLWKFYYFVIFTHYFDDTSLGQLIKWLDGTHLMKKYSEPVLPEYEQHDEMAKLMFD